MKIVVAPKKRLYHFFSAYAPQTGCSNQAKDEFWSLLDEKKAEVPSKDVIVVAGSLDGHVGAAKDGYSCHGGFGYGSRNADGKRFLEYARSHNLTIREHQDSDFVLVKDRDRKLVTDAKIVPYERVAPQHRPLHFEDRASETETGRAMRCTKNQVVANEREGSSCGFSRAFATVAETWKKATDSIRQAAQLELCFTKPGRRKVDKQTWLWTNDVEAKACHYHRGNDVYCMSDVLAEISHEVVLSISIRLLLGCFELRRNVHQRRSY
ncbi:unnamed protein product [Heligmosomoides polygyrus]|uniref:Glutamine amidotransferase type-2 domain-containing protein n=1 Tax=Heligmosomoides polygyrus TaxID=6339 RepID=A0A183GAJ2_HELPZ|nr:unnamed protein product [Heligmosomoides polygyrus]